MNILTGLQANSGLHLGNYLGGILPMVEMSKNLGSEDKLFMFVPDLHSFTLPIDYTKLYANTLQNIATYIAAGIDPTKENVLLYRQSFVTAHSELAWILSCFTYFGEASRMTQFKDKSSKHENVSVGLFTYPILMAADILLYAADFVPVGDDQKQHIELARDLAGRINNKFERDIFVLPQAWDKQLEFMKLKEGVRIRSLSNPLAKMSKSVVDPKGTILLSDNPQEAAKKVMSAATDSVGVINWDWENQSGITNLLQIEALLNHKDISEVVGLWSGKTQYGELKKAVAQTVETFLIEFQNKLETLDQSKLEQILQAGENNAQAISQERLLQVQKAIGLRR